MQLSTDYPWYFILLCIAAGAIFAFALYWRRWQKERSKSTLWLALLRFASVSTIAFLLLSPMIKSERQEREKPIILIAQDNSRSIAMSEDSITLAQRYAQPMSDMIRSLKEDYDVHCFKYGSAVAEGETPDYNDPATDLFSAIKDLQERYAGRNVGAMIVSGDGIVNMGQSPINSEPLPYPLYTIALGDTNVRKDASIPFVRYNHIAYLNNQFPIEAVVNANEMQGQTQQVSVSHKGHVVASQAITFTNRKHAETITFNIKAEEPGLQSYTITVNPSDGEASLQNNSRTFTIEVIDGHQKIAILAAVPHPDIAALRRSIESNDNYEVEAFVGDQWQNERRNWQGDFDLLILHNLPKREATFDLPISQTPVIFVVGSQTDLNKYNSLNTGVEIVSKLEKQTEATASLNSDFTLFKIEKATSSTIERLPPLSSPFGDYRATANTYAPFNATISGIASSQPLIAVSQNDGIRRAMIFGEGLWRWRLHEYMEEGKTSAVDELIDNIVTYTASRDARKRFRVNTKSIYSNNEAVTIDAELYDDNYQPTNQPESEIIVNGTKYTFAKSGNGYRLNLGMLDTGIYTYTASVNFAGTQHNASGRFAVESSEIESFNLVADHAMLNTLAHRNRGAMLMPSDIESIPQLLKERNDIKSIIYSHKSYSELINLPLLFALIIILLAAEWILRKYGGEL